MIKGIIKFILLLIIFFLLLIISGGLVSYLGDIHMSLYQRGKLNISPEAFNRLSIVALIILDAAIVFFLLSHKRSLKSKTKIVAGKIELPVSAGESQYGSARFLGKKRNLDELFSSYTISSTLKDKLCLNETMDFKLLDKGGIVVSMEKILGKEKIRYIDTNSHLICIGKTGSGKTRHVVIQSILTLILAGESLVISDPKGEIYDYSSDFAKKLNYKINVIDFKRPELSMSYNPLSPIIEKIDEGRLDEAQDLTWDLVSILVDNKNNRSEKVWENGEKAVLGAAILAVIYDNKDKKEYQNLSYVYVFMAEMCKDIALGPFTLNPFSVYIDSLEDTHPAKMTLAIANIAPEKMKGSFFTSALTTLRLFSSKSIYNISKKSDISLSSMGNKKEVLYIILPDEKTSYYQIASLIIAQQYQDLVNLADDNGGRLKVRVNYILDEFGNFSRIPDIKAKLTAARSRAIRFAFFIQAYDQLVEKYGKEIANIIKANSENTIYLGTSDYDIKEAISKQLGTYTTSSFSLSKNNKSFSSTSTESSNYIQRDLLKAEELGRIDRPYQLILNDKGSVILKSPGLEEWYFNEILDLKDEDYNQKKRKEKLDSRYRREDIDEDILVNREFLNFWKKKVEEVLTNKLKAIMKKR